MKKAVLLACVAVLALTAGRASAADPAFYGREKYNGFHHDIKKPGTRFLWNQNSNYGSDAVNSQNFTSGSTSAYTAYDDISADDFVVPAGQTWHVTEVDVSGQYSSGGIATSEKIVFFHDRKGMPSSTVRHGRFNSLKGTDNGGNFSLILPRAGLSLSPGTYWVGVVVNMNSQTEGRWYWNTNQVQHGYQAQWMNAGGGWGVCPSWGTITDCQNANAPDLMFDLKGSRHKTKQMQKGQ